MSIIGATLALFWSMAMFSAAGSSFWRVAHNQGPVANTFWGIACVAAGLTGFALYIACVIQDEQEHP